MIENGDEGDYMTTKDSYEIVQHNMNVSKMAEAFCHYLKLDENECQTVAVAGVFLDLGKIAMDYRVFTKAEALTKKEFDYVKQHASKSTELLIQSNLISKEILACIIHHHENYDGTGYPTKVKGESIPFGARVLKICDVYQALTEPRPYRKFFCHEEAVKIMNKEREVYDPELLEQFVNFIEIYHTPN